MKNLKAENKLVVALFIMVLVTFSFAQKDSKRIEQLYVRAGQPQPLLAPQDTQKEISQTSYLARISPSR